MNTICPKYLVITDGAVLLNSVRCTLAQVIPRELTFLAEFLQSAMRQIIFFFKTVPNFYIVHNIRDVTLVLSY